MLDEALRDKARKKAVRERALAKALHMMLLAIELANV